MAAKPSTTVSIAQLERSIETLRSQLQKAKLARVISATKNLAKAEKEYLQQTKLLQKASLKTTTAADRAALKKAQKAVMVTENTIQVLRTDLQQATAAVDFAQAVTDELQNALPKPAKVKTAITKKAVHKPLAAADTKASAKPVSVVHEDAPTANQSSRKSTTKKVAAVKPSKTRTKVKKAEQVDFLGDAIDSAASLEKINKAPLKSPLAVPAVEPETLAPVQTSMFGEPQEHLPKPTEVYPDPITTTPSLPPASAHSLRPDHGTTRMIEPREQALPKPQEVGINYSTLPTTDAE